MSQTNCKHVWWSYLARVECERWLVLALPLVLFVLNRDWAVPDVIAGYIDTWVYTGFFLNLRHHVHLFPDTYYGCRLGWVIPGYLAHHIFPARAANYALRLMLIYGTSLPLYGLLRTTVHRRAAVIGALTLGCYGWFFFSIGWDYVDGAANMYFVLALYALMRAGAGAAWKRWVSVAGALYLACLSVQLLLITFAPLLGFFYVVWNHRNQRRPLWLSAILFGGGALAAGAAFGGTNRLLGESWLWFMPSIRVMKSLTQVNPWKQNVSVWLPYSAYLAMPMVVAVSALVALTLGALRGWRQKAPMAMFFQAYYLATIAVMVASELRGAYVFEYVFYASYLMPGMFLALGSLVGVLAEPLSEGRFRLVLLALLGTGSLPFVHALDLSWAPMYTPRHLGILLGIGLAGMSLLIVRRWRGWTVMTALVALGLCNWINADPRVFPRERSPQRTETWAAVIHGTRSLRAWEGDGNFQLWYDGDEMEGNVMVGRCFNSISACYLWGYKVINAYYPRLDIGLGGVPLALGPKHRLIVFTSKSETEKAVQQLWGAKGYDVAFNGEQKVEEGDIHFRMLMLTATRRPNAGSTVERTMRQ